MISFTRSGLWIGLFFLTHSFAHASDLKLVVPGFYDEGARVREKVRECVQINEVVVDSTYKIIKSKLPATERVESTRVESISGRAMTVTILDVIAEGGGGWSGKKTISVQADLYQDGVAVKSTVLRRSGAGGVFGAVKGTCSIVQDVAEVVGADVAKWYLKVARTLAKGQPKEIAQAK